MLREDPNTNETIALSNAFIIYVEKNVFVHINDVSFKLVEIYILNCDEEEALAVCDAMQKLESQRNITRETADALTQETSIDPPLMTSLFDERIKLQLINNNFKKAKVVRQNQAVSTKVKMGSKKAKTTPSTNNNNQNTSNKHNISSKKTSTHNHPQKKKFHPHNNNFHPHNNDLNSNWRHNYRQTFERETI